MNRNFQITWLQIFLSGIARMIDSIIWLLTGTYYRTNLHMKITNMGHPEANDRGWFEKANDVTIRTAGEFTAQRVQPRSSMVLLAFVLLADGLITALSLGLVPSELGAQLTLSDYWKENVEPAFSLSSKHITR